MRRAALLAVVTLVATTGCSRDDKNVSPTPPSESAKTTATATTAPGPVASAKQTDGTVATWSGRCAEVVVALQKEVASLPSKCTADADCVCYRGGVGGVTDCGAVSDLATAKRIDALTTEFGEARCSY